MMGIAVADLSPPITKTSGAVTVLTARQIGKSQRQTACIRCGRCLRACPEHLSPTKIAHAVKNNLLDLTGYIKTGKILLARQKKRIPA